MNDRTQATRTGHSLTISTEIQIRTVADIVSRLATLYPEKFGGDQGIGWGLEFGRHLNNQPPDRLNYAWDKVMGNWRKATHPLPGHFKEAIEHMPKPKNTEGGRPKYRHDWDAIHQIAANRIQSMGQQHQGRMEALGETERYDLMRHWKTFADMVAQFEHRRAWLIDNDLPLREYEDPVRKAAAYYKMGAVANPWFPGRFAVLVDGTTSETFES